MGLDPLSSAKVTILSIFQTLRLQLCDASQRHQDVLVGAGPATSWSPRKMLNIYRTYGKSKKGATHLQQIPKRIQPEDRETGSHQESDSGNRERFGQSLHSSIKILRVEGHWVPAAAFVVTPSIFDFHHWKASSQKEWTQRYGSCIAIGLRDMQKKLPVTIVSLSSRYNTATTWACLKIGYQEGAIRWVWASPAHAFFGSRAHAQGGLTWARVFSLTRTRARRVFSLTRARARVCGVGWGGAVNVHLRLQTHALSWGRTELNNFPPLRSTKPLSPFYFFI